MINTCEEVIESLMAYVNNELSAECRAAIDAHLAVCPECVTFLKTYEQTIRYELAAFEKTEQIVQESMPESLVQAILSARAKELK
jgi:anti-sigma factor RsiW